MTLSVSEISLNITQSLLTNCKIFYQKKQDGFEQTEQSHQTRNSRLAVFSSFPYTDKHYG